MLDGYDFSRDSDATYRDSDGVIQTVGVGVLPDSHFVLDPTTGLFVRSALLEGARTNELEDSNNFADGGSAWSTGDAFNVSEVAGLFAGESGWRHENDGTGSSHNRRQIYGTLTGDDETFSIIVENVDAERTKWGIRDMTEVAWVIGASFDWATETVSSWVGAGVQRAEKLADAGPNGGPVFRLSVTGAGMAGNTGQAYLYVTDITTNTDTAIIHHGQHEEASFPTSPIVTTDAPVSRHADTLTYTRNYSGSVRQIRSYIDLATGNRVDEDEVVGVSSGPFTFPADRAWLRWTEEPV